jgi:hypothetical protein
MDSTAKQNQTQGLKTRLGKSFGKFSKAGSLWHWTFQWANNMQKQDGYDSGMIETNYDVFQRLKLRFFDGVLLNKHNKGKNYSELIAGGNVYLRTNPNAENNHEDMLMFSFNITWATDMMSGKNYRQVKFTLNEAGCRACKLTRGQVKYIQELFGSYELQVKSQFGIKTNKVDVLAMMSASVPSKNVESQQNTQNTENTQPITATYTQNVQPDNRTGEPVSIKSLPLKVVKKEVSEMDRKGKELYSNFINLLKSVNLDFCVKMLDNADFTSYDGFKVVLSVFNKSFYQALESTYHEDFKKLMRNVFGQSILIEYIIKV